MSTRDALNRYSSVVTVVAIVVLLVALLVILKGGVREPGALKGNSYFYDLNTGKLFTEPATSIAPIDAPSGPLKGTEDAPAGVRAYVVGCGDCTPDNRQIAHLAKLPAEQKNQLEAEKAKHGKLSFASVQLMSTGLLIAPVPQDAAKINWVAPNGPAGRELMARYQSLCPDGSTPEDCQP